MEPFNIVALDPGGTTGIALATYLGPIDGHEDTIDDFHIGTTQFGPDEHHWQLWEFLTFQRDMVSARLQIVTESFEFRQNLDKRKVNLISKEYIGITKLFAKQNDLCYTEQTASMAKGFVSDEKLIKLGIFETPKTPMVHRNDALRHLIRYMVVNLKIRSPIVDKWHS